MTTATGMAAGDASQALFHTHNLQEMPLVAKSVEPRALTRKEVWGGQDDDRRIISRRCA